MACRAKNWMRPVRWDGWVRRGGARMIEWPSGEPRTIKEQVMIEPTPMSARDTGMCRMVLGGVLDEFREPELPAGGYERPPGARAFGDTALTDEQLREAYYFLLLARGLDDRMWALNRQGKAPFVISCAGHEGIQVG